MTVADDSLLGRAETWALVACQPLAQLSNQALLPSLGSMRADLDLDYIELGWVVAAFGVARLLVDLPAGGIASRWNPRAVLMVAFAASAAASAMGVFAANVWQIGAVRLLIGGASSIAQAMILAWILGGSGRAARGRVMARSEAFFSVTGLVIPALGGLLAGSFGWRVAFVLGALAAVVGLLAVLGFTRAGSAARAVGLVVERTAVSSEMPEPGWLELRRGGPMLLCAYLATFVVFFSRNGLLNAGFPVLGADQLGLDPFQIGLLFSTLNAVGIGAVLLAGRLSDRFGRYRVLVPGLALLLASQLLMFLIHDQVTYLLVGLFQGAAAFANPIPTSLLGDALPPRLRAHGIAVYRAVCDVAILSAPAVLGLTLQLGGFAAAEFVTASTTLGVLIVIWTLGHARHPSL
ncbi:MAG TPA: MFS transporter [Chloroflexota bacterium]|nr:MFS transporter [Chloroflexota bacterium]